ncbi:ER-associated proteolytic system protein Der1 [Microthyrium microscopicum]|uniref:Derlin n=1 Tax=Microthyrium microscopicum TaxID=703497 RepID=A0A6A6U269_9PEZI|nr:ER-associated proteolytic system protein Der1 [Microthyrium microscopicum]
MADFNNPGGIAAQFPLEQWFYEMPPCTRYWTTGVLLTSLLVQCHVISPFNMFYSLNAIFNKGQYWRLISSYFYFGPLGVDLLFHVFFLQRYARLLEEASGRSPARFSWLLVFCGVSLSCLAPMLHIFFLGTALSSVLVYIWSRRNPDAMLSFLGLLTFRAPWLPWVLMGFSFVMHGIVPKDEICGVIVGHVWYYFNDIYPPVHGGSRPLDPPQFWIRLWENAPVEERVETDDARQEFAVPPVADLPADGAL